MVNVGSFEIRDNGVSAVTAQDRARAPDFVGADHLVAVDIERAFNGRGRDGRAC